MPPLYRFSIVDCSTEEAKERASLPSSCPISTLFAGVDNESKQQPGLPLLLLLLLLYLGVALFAVTRLTWPSFHYSRMTDVRKRNSKPIQTEFLRRVPVSCGDLSRPQGINRLASHESTPYIYVSFLSIFYGPRSGGFKHFPSRTFPGCIVPAKSHHLRSSR